MQLARGRVDDVEDGFGGGERARLWRLAAPEGGPRNASGALIARETAHAQAADVARVPFRVETGAEEDCPGGLEADSRPS